MQSFVSFFLLLLQRPYLTSFRCFVINLVLYCTFSISYSLHANPKKCRVWGSSLRPEKARRITQLQSLVRVEFTLVVEYKCSCNYYTQNLPCSWHLNRQPKGKSPESNHNPTQNAQGTFLIKSYHHRITIIIEINLVPTSYTSYIYAVHLKLLLEKMKVAGLRRHSIGLFSLKYGRTLAPVYQTISIHDTFDSIKMLVF